MPVFDGPTMMRGETATVRLDLSEVVRFPIIAFWRSGGVNRADDAEELTSASPSDDLQAWQGLEVYDSAGMKFVVAEAVRGWPSSSLGALLCRVANHAIYVSLKAPAGVPVGVDELRERLSEKWLVPAGLHPSSSHHEIIEAL